MCGTCVGAPLGGVASVCLGALVCVFGRRSHLELLESLRACFHRLHPTQRALALKVLPDDPKRVLAKVVIGEAIGGAEELAAEAERRGGRHTHTHTTPFSAAIPTSETRAHPAGSLAVRAQEG